MKVLLTGAAGQLGEALQRSRPGSVVELRALTRQELDLADPEACRRAVAEYRPDWLINAGAYTHTSIALHDAIKGAGALVIELHISNVHAREAFRHHSYISPAAKAVMAGFGVPGYALAIAGLAQS